VDENLGLAYLPVELPTGDYYGGYRPGNGLFGESIVAIDLKTGERKWHYQLVHHGMWDFDIPCAPVLVDINHRWQAGQGIGTSHQTIDPVRSEPCDRRTDLADCRTAGAKGDAPGEWYSPRNRSD